MPKEKQYLSASTLKTLEKCSWQHWCKKHLKLPDKNNDGARRGTICHALLEYLQNERHRANYNRIIEADSVSGDAACQRLVERHFVIADMDDKSEDNLQLVKDMLMIGLKYDFFCEEDGGELGNAEEDFLIENEDPPYIIKGYIDKNAVYDKGKTLKIIDYKTSKSKFSKSDLESERQAMMYTLAAKSSWGRKKWPKAKKVVFNFLFLKPNLQKNGPIQEVQFSEDAIKGFEAYISSVFMLINDFTEEKAKANFAKTNGNHWICGPAKSGWICPYNLPFDYYVLLDKDSSILQTSRKKKDLKAAKGQKIEKRSYSGCPAIHGESHGGNKTENYDPFDF